MTVKRPKGLAKLDQPFAAGKMIYLTPEEAMEIRLYINELQLESVEARREVVAGLALFDALIGERVLKIVMEEEEQP